MSELWRDLRYVVRVLWKNPSFTAISILTLALGLGATAAMFSVVHGVILQPMPFDQAEQLVVAWEIKHGKRLPAAAGNFADWRRDSQSFDHLVMADLVTVNLVGDGAPSRVPIAKVSAGFFDLLRIPARHGRLFHEGEDEAGRERVAVLSWGLFQRRFGGQSAVVGHTVTLDDVPYEIIGVTPESFRFPYLGQAQDLWVPRVITQQEESAEGRQIRAYGVLGRLKPGVSVQQGMDELRTVASHLAETYPLTNAGWTVDLVSLYDQSVKEAGKAMFLLLGAVGLLLLIALANVANLTMARNTVRQREIALRRALGSGHWGLARQLLLESVLMTVLAALLGLGLAKILVQLLLFVNPGKILRIDEVAITAPVVAVVLAVAVAAGLLLGLIPILGLRRMNPYESLKQGGGKATGSRATAWVRNSLLTAETALVLVLLMVGGLMAQGFQQLMAVNPGFATEDRLEMEVPLLRSQYPSKEAKRLFFEGLEARLGNLPGVEKVGLVSTLPLTPTSAIRLGFVEEGKPVDLSTVPVVNFDVATPSFFAAAGIPLLSGRLFEDRDREGTPDVLLINQTMAQRFWPGEDPIGKRLQIRDPGGPWVEIIGVIGDVRQEGLDKEAQAAMFQPLAQMAIDRPIFHAVVWAKKGQLNNLAPTLRQTVWDIAPDQVAEVRLLEDLTRNSVKSQRFNMLLLGTFSIIALLLGTVGIYGVVSYSVNQQRKQIGIRAAVGAQRQDIFRWIGIKGLTPVVTGIGIGIVAALFLGSTIGKFVHGLNPHDPATLIGVSILLLAVAAVAIYFPARRAARVNPLTVLRAE